MDSADDVIFIESSDDDSDCRIVKVVPSPAKRGKNKSRWQNKPSNNNTQGTRTSQRGREMVMRQLNEAVYEERPSMSSAPREYAKRLSVGLMTTRCGLQGTSSNTDDLPGAGPNNTRTVNRTGSGAIQHVDLEDPFSGQQYTAGPETASTSFLCLAQSVECKQEPRHQDEDDNDDKQRSARSRSGSTATLDFSPGRQRYKNSGKDAHGIIGMFDKPSEWTELIDARSCTTPDAFTMRAMPHNDGYPTPTREPSLEKRELELQDGGNSCEMDSMFLRNNMGSSLQPHKEAPSESRRQLPWAGRWPAWDSVINVAAFEALPGPLFTRPKQILDTVTYEAVMEEKTTREEKERKRKYNNVVSC